MIMLRIAKTTSLIFAILFSSDSVSAQETDYRVLWARGDYAEAVKVLERASYHPWSSRRDYAELLVLTGRVDEAIAQLGGVGSALDVTVRLAELYRMRGRMGDYGLALMKAEDQVRLLSEYRPDVDDLVAVARLRELKGEDPKSLLRFYNLMAEVFPNSAAVLV
ncbi:MAG: tetratricopeptide repeat protein, partial [Gemmatimonadetes bacterium]|nr:tetratricopeptide repeat protein [Gemmatimonadota bacterium]